MYNEQNRFYIQDRHDQSKFLKKITFSQTYPSLAFTNIYSYIPNISDFPLSFTSLNSVSDYITNTLFNDLSSNSVSEISYELLNNLRNLKITIVNKYDTLISGTWHPDCDNPALNSLDQYVRKAAFKWNACKIFNTKIAEHYIERTELNSRIMGIDPNYSNRYIIDTNLDNNSFYTLQSNLCNIGVAHETDAKNGVLILPDIENLNLARISVEHANSWAVFREEELRNLESHMTFNMPLRMNYYSGSTVH